MNSIGRTQGLVQEIVMFHMLKIEYEISFDRLKMSSYTNSKLVRVVA